jgi:ribonuclease J
METMLDVSLSLGYSNFNKNILVKLDKIKNIKDENLVIITTGSQGEEMSALYRIAHNLHKQISITNNDLVILSSSAIPGNEKSINNMGQKMLH